MSRDNRDSLMEDGEKRMNRAGKNYIRRRVLKVLKEFRPADYLSSHACFNALERKLKQETNLDSIPEHDLQV